SSVSTPPVRPTTTATAASCSTCSATWQAATDATFPGKCPYMGHFPGKVPLISPTRRCGDTDVHTGARRCHRRTRGARAGQRRLRDEPARRAVAVADRSGISAGADTAARDRAHHDGRVPRTRPYRLAQRGLGDDGT